MWQSKDRLKAISLNGNLTGFAYNANPDGSGVDKVSFVYRVQDENTIVVSGPLLKDVMTLEEGALHDGNSEQVFYRASALAIATYRPVMLRP